MSAIRLTVLMCDCDLAEVGKICHAEVEGKTVDEARAKAKKEGWVYTRHNSKPVDLCAKHAEFFAMDRRMQEREHNKVNDATMVALRKMDEPTAEDLVEDSA